ncbi:MAG: 1-deoxy-D-xylulose-5-phosphate reductoisomerase [Armatimonadota bacterium]
MKKIALLGSTGSIGTQALDVVSRLPDRLKIVSMAAHQNIELFAEQIRIFKPELVSIGSQKAAEKLQELTADIKCLNIMWGDEGLKAVASYREADVTVVAVAGMVGLAPTIAAVEAGKDIALASKEVLVSAGSLVTSLIRKHGVKLLPVDSEHSAIFQCLQGEDSSSVRRLLLTASGGALAKYDISELEHVTVDQALAHPNWSMGRKITIDSATLMNKALEVIEASWLFNIDVLKIDVVIHPQSVIHSMVEYIDGSVIAQLGVPDMRLPIQYALLYPERVDTNLPRLNVIEQGALTFGEPDAARYPGLELAYTAVRHGGTMPAVMNAANETAAGLFLDNKISFTAIQEIIRRVMESHSPISDPDLDTIMIWDIWAREETVRISEETGGR